MLLRLICTILCQFHVIHGTPDVNLKFYKNVKVNNSLLNEIHKAVINFKPIIIPQVSLDIQDKELETYDNVTMNAMNTHLYSRLKYKLPTILSKYQSYSIKKGVTKIKSITKYIATELSIKEDKLPPINYIVNNFTMKVNHYFNNLKKEKCETDIDKEFLVMNTVNTVNSLLYNEQLSVVSDLILKSNMNVPKHHILTIIKRFYQDLNENKRDDMEYLCIKFDICRPVLAFTDYISDVIRELLKLSDVKLIDFYLKLSIPVKDQAQFFQSILGESTANKIGSKIEDGILKNVSTIRKVLMVLRSYLTNKHILVKNVDQEQNIKNKARRILIDIIDKTFDVDGDELLSVHFDLLLKTIENWSVERKNEIQKVLKAFVDQAVELMKNNLSDEAKLEIRSLIDVLLKKEDRSNKIYRYLFTDGSKFVRGEDISTKLSLLL